MDKFTKSQENVNIKLQVNCITPPQIGKIIKSLRIETLGKDVKNQEFFLIHHRWKSDWHKHSRQQLENG